ncbi:MAG TPA: Fic family protein [Planctomycetota bacterium]|jgi:Fic family protein|nr:Fic family protein [Planctomycetota bacterium]
MMSFRGERIRELALPTGPVWLLTEIAESKGRQDLYAKQAPQVLKALREMALVQSAESSNRIEGVTVDPSRLRPLVLGNARPRDRSEEEIQGYRQALQSIHAGAADLEITPDFLLLLHRTIQEGSGDAGQWKRVENEIVELRRDAAPVLRFRPVSVVQIPSAVEELCLSRRRALDEGRVPPLVVVACFVLDFLCILPFRDGNGRVWRLLTLLDLYRHGYEVGRYVSLERLVEESREESYEALRRSSEGWHEGKHDLLPWINYFLSILRRAYREFEVRAGQVKSPRGAKRALVVAAVEAFPGTFRLADVERACPGVSRDMVRRVLRELRKAGRISCLARGRDAAWRKGGKPPLTG